jgi:hypothetical protein
MPGFFLRIVYVKPDESADHNNFAVRLPLFPAVCGIEGVRRHCRAQFNRVEAAKVTVADTHIPDSLHIAFVNVLLLQKLLYCVPNPFLRKFNLLFLFHFFLHSEAFCAENAGGISNSALRSKEFVTLQRTYSASKLSSLRPPR